MNKIKRKIILIFSLIAFLFLEIYVLQSRGILVKYQRNSGPELIVIMGCNELRKRADKFDVNYTGEVYTTYEFDNNDGFENIGTSFAFYRVIASKEIDDSSFQKVPVIEIKRFYSLISVVLLLIVSLIVPIAILKMLKII